MSNAFQNVTSGLAELKTWFQGPMVDGLNENCPVYRASEKIKAKWDGDSVVRPLRLRRNQGIGATSDGGNLPAIGRQGSTRATINNKYNYLRFGITGPMIKAAQTDRGSFVRSASFELEMGYKDLTTNLNRQLIWDGSGTIATISSAVSGSSTAVIAGRTSAEPALKYIDVGTTFDVYSGSTLIASGIQVVSISSGTASSATATVVCDQTFTAAAATNLVLSGSYGNEITGLLYALDGGTSTIYGVDRSAYIAYQGNSSDQASAQLTLDAMQNIWNEGMRRGNLGKYSAVYCDYTSLRYYQKLLVTDKRYTNTVKGDGTFGSADGYYMDFSGLPIVPDKDSPVRFFFLPQEVLEFYINCEMEFADETGTMYIAQTDTDSFEVRIRHFGNFFNSQPSACALLTGYISP